MIKKLKSKVKKLKDFVLKGERVFDNFNNASMQVVLKNQYKMMKTMNPSCLPQLSEVGFSAYSQFEEDGILLYIFSIIGEGRKRVVEICAGSGMECMATNLIINHGWEGLLFDGSEDNVRIGQEFFVKNKATFLHPTRFCQNWITSENVNELIRSNGFSGEVDLLSLDIDGNDYWILKAIEVISPRVIICETNNVIPSELALTIPYDAEFNYLNSSKEKQDFVGVSLLAMEKLCKSKGYRLIGAHKYGFNVIFMKNDKGEEYFPEVSIETIHNNPYTIEARKNRWLAVKDLGWEKV